MKVNFITELKNDTGTLVFLCIKNHTIDKYLNSLNTKIKGYIDKAIKVSSMEYKSEVVSMIHIVVLFLLDDLQISQIS